MITSHTLCNERIRELAATIADVLRANTEIRDELQELEAENERLQTTMGICSGPCHGRAGEQYVVKVHEVEAELAALKARRCETCHYGDDHMLARCRECRFGDMWTTPAEAKP